MWPTSFCTTTEALLRLRVILTARRLRLKDFNPNNHHSTRTSSLTRLVLDEVHSIRRTLRRAIFRRKVKPDGFGFSLFASHLRPEHHYCRPQPNRVIPLPTS
jgi:hypothetical protein